MIDDSTIRMTLDGDVDSDPVMDCIVAGAILSADQTMILVYPNGEQTCE